MGFNSGFKGLIYIVHLVGYFHSCITMHGCMNVKYTRNICSIIEMWEGGGGDFVLPQVLDSFYSYQKGYNFQKCC